MTFFLASTSPARLMLMRQAGIEPVLLPSGVDEDAAVRQAEDTWGRTATTDEVVTLLAEAKARAALELALAARADHADPASADRSLAERARGAHPTPRAGLRPDTALPLAAQAERELDLTGVLFGGDSSLELDGVTYGKPHTAERAMERWRAQRGRWATLHSGHFVMRIEHGEVLATASAARATRLHFADDVSDAEIETYVSTGEPLEVAGAFTIDGRGAAFIDELQGDPSAVIGMSLPVVRRLCAEVGVGWSELWNRP